MAGGLSAKEYFRTVATNLKCAGRAPPSQKSAPAGHRLSRRARMLKHSLLVKRRYMQDSVLHLPGGDNPLLDLLNSLQIYRSGRYAANKARAICFG